MRKIPNLIKIRVGNAKYYLECADEFPPPTKNATHILLLLISWENIIIADSEMQGWIHKKKIDSKIYRDHSYKFKKASAIQHVILGAKRTKTIEYSSPNDFKKLREYCQYGFGNELKSLPESFNSAWHTEIFRNTLINKIQRTKSLIKIVESLSN